MKLDLPLIATLPLGDGIYLFAKDNPSNLQFYISAIVYWSICIICFFFVTSGTLEILKQEKERLKEDNQKKLIIEQLSYSMEIENIYHIIRKWNHDYSSHLLSISYLLSQDKFEDAEKYIGDIYTNSFTITNDTLKYNKGDNSL